MNEKLNKNAYTINEEEKLKERNFRQIGKSRNPVRLNRMAITLAIGFCLSISIFAQDILFFSRAADLGENQGWVLEEFSEGEVTLDLRVKRWSGSNWTHCVSGEDCKTNEGHLNWKKPVYSPVDGRIRACWRNYEDNPKPGVKLDKVTGNNGVKRTIQKGGNHVVIETNDGRVISIAHFKKGTIDSSLCPNNAEELQNIKNRFGKEDDEDGLYPKESVIPALQKPKIKKGQFIGLAGNSGNSDYPHIHIHITKKTGPFGESKARLPIKFEHVWLQRHRENENIKADNWYESNLKALTKSGTGTTIIHPSPFLYRSSKASESVQSVKPVFLNGNRLITAVKLPDDRLKLISWDYTGLQNFNPKHSLIQEKFTLISIEKFSNDYFLTAMRDYQGNLKMIFYYVDPLGKIILKDEVTAGSIKQLDLTMINANGKKFITAVKLPTGNLKLMAWKIDFTSSGNIKIKRLGDIATGDQINSVRITSASNFQGVAVAAQTSAKKLKVFTFTVSNDGMTINKKGFIEESTIFGKPDITMIPKGVVAVMKDHRGKLRVTSYETKNTGEILRRDTETSGGVSEVNIQRTPLSGSRVITSVTDDSGKLQLYSWSMNDNGANLYISGSSKVDVASKVETASSTRSQAGQPLRDFMVTAFVNKDNKLGLINWETNLNP